MCGTCLIWYRYDRYNEAVRLDVPAFLEAYEAQDKSVAEMRADVKAERAKVEEVEATVPLDVVSLAGARTHDWPMPHEPRRRSNPRLADAA